MASRAPGDRCSPWDREGKPFTSNPGRRSSGSSQGRGSRAGGGQSPGNPCQLPTCSVRSLPGPLGPWDQKVRRKRVRMLALGVPASGRPVLVPGQPTRLKRLQRFCFGEEKRSASLLVCIVPFGKNGLSARRWVPQVRARTLVIRSRT